ncbi:MAG: histidine kinase [Bacteroides sp.]|jgi:hypothetical protein|nr:histidine kinase [Bacteroides sp.]MCI1681592.1 histidine kinase [Bacteroides sp.]
MVGKITKGLFSNAYFRISVTILIGFIFATWYLNKQVEKEAVKNIDITMQRTAINSIQVVTNILNNYESQLLFLQTIFSSNAPVTVLQKTIANIKKLDPSIDSIYVEPFTLPNSLQTGIPRCKVVERNGSRFIKFSLSLNASSQLSFLISLMKFHKKITEIKDKNYYAYVTIASDSIYLYHPDEKRIGGKVEALDLANEKKIFSSSKDIMENVYSDYLGFPVYRYYKLVDMGGEKWIFTANPDMGLSDSIKQTGNNFLIISIVAICSFLAVFALSILRWKKEFAARRAIERQNMNLLLKAEQQKQIMVSAELERLKSGLNPHFLFNSLGSLRALISKDTQIAKEFAMTLSDLYRYMLRQEDQNLVTLKEELEFTENYISLQKIRFANKIITEINIPTELLECKVPPISLQLLVENCIKHTKISDSEPLHIQIYAEEHLLAVANNYNPRESEMEYSGKGIENLIKRYSFLTQINCQFEISKGYYIAKIPLIFTQ